jgi:hypothetical protein
MVVATNHQYLNARYIHLMLHHLISPLNHHAACTLTASGCLAGDDALAADFI